VGNFFPFIVIVRFYLSIMIEGKEKNLDSISFGRGAVDIQIRLGHIRLLSIFLPRNSSVDVDVYAHFYHSL
jgi:hypothetical protein